jgi:hypothetical protein
MALSHFCFCGQRSAFSKEKPMARSKRVTKTKLVQLKKMVPHVKKLGKRAAKTSAVKA